MRIGRTLERFYQEHPVEMDAILVILARHFQDADSKQSTICASLRDGRTDVRQRGGEQPFSQRLSIVRSFQERLNVTRMSLP
jgi:hypothetical protein